MTAVDLKYAYVLRQRGGVRAEHYLHSSLWQLSERLGIALYLGASRGNRQFDGVIDDARVYNYQLTNKQIVSV